MSLLHGLRLEERLSSGGDPGCRGTGVSAADRGPYGLSAAKLRLSCGYRCRATGFLYLFFTNSAKTHIR